MGDSAGCSTRVLKPISLHGIPRFTLLLAAALFAVIAISKKHSMSPYAGHWRGLSFLFLYLSIDEGCMVHERIGDIFVRLAQGSWIAEMGWTAPVWGSDTSYRNLIHRFPEAPTGRDSTHLYSLRSIARREWADTGVCSADSFSSAMGPTNAITALLSTIEEPGEMLGVAVLIYALLSYMAEHIADVRIGISAQGTTTTVLPDLPEADKSVSR